MCKKNVGEKKGKQIAGGGGWGGNIMMDSGKLVFNFTSLDSISGTGDVRRSLYSSSRSRTAVVWSSVIPDESSVSAATRRAVDKFALDFRGLLQGGN